MMQKQGKSIKKETRAKKKPSGLNANVFNIKGTVVKRITLPKDVFGAKVNKPLLAQVARVYLANQRQGTVSTKTRGEVSGSTRKIYRQKGTGRARHGSNRAPIFVHGGIVFGPKPRDFSLILTRSMRKQALFSALSLKKKEEEIRFVSGLEKVVPKTKEIVRILKNLKCDLEKEKILIIASEYLQNVYRGVRNIKGVGLQEAYKLNAYDILSNDVILCMDSAVKKLEREEKQ